MLRESFWIGAKVDLTVFRPGDCRQSIPVAHILGFVFLCLEFGMVQIQAYNAVQGIHFVSIEVVPGNIYI